MYTGRPPDHLTILLYAPPQVAPFKVVLKENHSAQASLKPVHNSERNRILRLPRRRIESILIGPVVAILRTQIKVLRPHELLK
jgi:hypothetical protein